MSEPTEYDLRVDAFGRQWLKDHPEKLAFRLQGEPYVSVKPRGEALVELYDSFDEGYSSGCSCDMGPTFEVGLSVPLSDWSYYRISLQYGDDQIDVGAIIRAVLAVSDWR